MFDSCKWMIEYHPWSRPTHDLPDSLLHLGSIAMDWTFLASRFAFTVTASVKAIVGIIQQIPATWA